MNIKTSLLNIEINKFNDEFIYFKNKFILITKIKTDDKIGIYKNNIYLDSNEWFRYIRRRFNGQSYININNYLKVEFKKFIIFLDNYLEYLNIKNKKLTLTNKIYNYNNKLILGFYNLKSSYNNNKTIKVTINSILLILYEFNEKVKNKLHKKKVKIRKNSI